MLDDEDFKSLKTGAQLGLPFNQAAPHISASRLDEVVKQYPPADALAQKLGFRIVLREKSRSSSQNNAHVIFPHPEKHKNITFNSYRDCVEAAVKLGISLKGANLCDTHNRFNELDPSKDEQSPAGRREIKKRQSLRNGHYDGADFRNVICERVDFSNSSLRNANFSGDIDPISINKKEHHHRMLTEMANVIFDGCDLSHATFINCILDSASFRRGMNEEGTMVNPKLDHSIFKDNKADHLRIDSASVKEIRWQGEQFYNLTVNNVDFREMIAFPIFQIDSMRGCEFAQGLRPTGRRMPAPVSHMKTDAQF